MKNYIVKDGDLTKADEVIICHQVNCKGKMGSGVALAIKDKFPKAYKEYYELVQNYKLNNTASGKLLGTVQYVAIEEQDKHTRYIANMFAQDAYGYRGVYTSIEAFKKCLEDINKVGVGCNIAFPWKIGCVRGGADWDVVLNLILITLKDVNNIVFYKLDMG